MKGLKLPLEEFLRPFFNVGEKICIRVFDDKKTGVFKGRKMETSITEIDAINMTLRAHNDKLCGIYFVVNYGGHEDADITRINAQFMECDDVSIEEQMAQIEAFPIEPSLIVKTKKSLHTYWLMKDAEVSSFRRVQKKLAARFHGDSKCVNESRVLRLPGFYHCKDEPVMVDCIKFNPELRYTQAELEAVLPEIKDQQGEGATQNMKGPRKGLKLVGRRCDFIQHCKENAETLSEHDWYAMITNLAVFDGGDTVIHKLSSRYPGYNLGETQNKINHFLESETKPITCRTIAEKGFRCQKLEDGSCGCKAPAALCYKPLSVQDLRVFLSEAEIKKSASEDIQTAQEYIRDYLYNVDSIVGSTFIDYEMKEYFGLKAGSMKPLIQLQKELYKEYRDSKETRKETDVQEIPEWYEPTDHGMRFLPGILANHMAGNVQAFYGAGCYWGYDSGVYTMREDLWASAKVREFMMPRYTSMNAINDAVGQWRMLIRKDVREINCNPFIVNVKNGLYNILDDFFKPHTPEYYSTVQINATYTPGAGCPQFIAFLKSILQDEEIHLMQEIFGYLLIPINKAQKSFVFVGAPNAGKSTLLSVAQDILLGSENVSNIPWQNLADRFNKAELFGKLANIFADLPSKSIDDNGMFKALTGEDYITAERKNKDPFSFRPYARLLFSCNDIPRNYGDRSDGFYRRLIIIRFDHSIPKEERDPNLRERLAVERDGILMWALAGLKRLIDSSYVFSETDRTRSELRRYKVESNSVLSFVEEFCEVAESKVVVRDDLFTRYKEYCNNAGLRPVSQANFNKEIETSCTGVQRSRDRVSKRRTWLGIQYYEGGKELDI
jgi:putative DNA primase/helicase